MLSAHKGPFHIVSGEDVTIIAEFRLPFRFIICIVLAACQAMNFWEVSINFVRRMGFEFDFENRKIGYDDHLLWQHRWDGSITKPVPITPQPCRWHDDGNALWCSPFEPEDDLEWITPPSLKHAGEPPAPSRPDDDDESNYDENVIWTYPGRPDPEFDQGHPQRNAPDILDQVAKVLWDLENDENLPY